MELVIRLNGRDERVRVTRRDATYRVEIDGRRSYSVDVFELNVLVRSLLIDHDQYDVAVRRLADDRYQVSWEGRTDVAEVADPLTHLARESRSGVAGHQRQHVTAYMPGRVVAIKVAEGDQVTIGQPLLVLEAMKMQNEIQAESDGVVKKIVVVAGQAVEGGDLMLEIE